jgi:PAS domain S-box-containing protein
MDMPGKIKKGNTTSQLLKVGAVICGGLSMVLGFMVIVGWYTRNVTLIQVLPIFVPMQYNTALGFLLCGAGTLAMVFGCKRLTLVCGGIVGAVGFLTLMQYIFAVNFGIDQLLMKHYVTVETSHPGRMAPNTALCFGLTGIGLLVLCCYKLSRWRFLITGLLGPIAAALGTAAFFGYISSVETAYGWGELTRMAVHTALGFIVLGTGIFMIAWRQEISEKGGIPPWIAFPVGIGMTTIALVQWQALTAQERTLSPLPTVVLVVGFAIAALLTLTVHLSQKLWNRSKQIQQARITLMEEKDKKQMYLDIAEVILVALDKNGQITLINRKGCRILGYEYGELIGKNWFKTCLPPENRHDVFEIFKQLMEGKIEPVEYYENPVLTGSGEVRLIAWHNAHLKNEHGNIVGTLSSGQDITEQKQAENELKNSLKEKELLVKEVHHRVKNNMAVISSLLNLQAEKFEDPSVLNAFRDSRHRIRSMALVHEKLYQAKDLSKIEFSQYIKDLSQQVSRSIEFQGARIRVKVKADNIKLGIDTAIPCGLIINELLTNAFKYAFPHNRTGMIHIRMQLKENKYYKLIISDNGVGLPRYIDVQNPSTFGLNLVYLLTQQLEGEVEAQREKGTSFIITFPIKPSY